MLTTTEFRSHWIDSAGRCYAQRHPYYAAQLRPVINLDEVRAWIALATSDAMRRIGFPGGRDDDAAVFHLREVIERGAATDDHLAAETGRELCDDVPRYAQQSGADWRTPFVAMRERWPLPTLGGVSEIRNLTPHAVVVHEITFAPSGVIARATEESTAAAPIRLSIPDPAGAPADRIAFEVPTSTAEYTGLVDLPAPEPGVYLIVSMVVAQVAADRARWTGDLLVPGQQVRDPAGPHHRLPVAVPLCARDRAAAWLGTARGRPGHARGRTAAYELIRGTTGACAPSPSCCYSSPPAAVRRRPLSPRPVQRVRAARSAPRT